MPKHLRSTVAGFAAGLALTIAPLLAAGVATAADAATPAPNAAVASTPAIAMPNAAADAQYLVGQFTPAKAAANPGTAADVILGLAASGSEHTSTTALNAALQKAAPSYAKKAGAAAKLAIVAAAMGDSPANYGGVNLVSVITSAVSAGHGNLGDPFTQSLAIVALHRAGVAVPASMVSALLADQNASGAFGWVSGSTFSPDPDTTGLAIMALADLNTPAGQTAVTKAVTWATQHRTADGYWTSYGPSNTAGYLGSAVQAQGVDLSATISWLKGQQAKAGGAGLPASLNGTKPDVMATAQGLLLLGGVSLNTVSLQQAMPSASASASPVATATNGGGGTTAIVVIIAVIAAAAAVLLIGRGRGWFKRA